MISPILVIALLVLLGNQVAAQNVQMPEWPTIAEYFANAEMEGYTASVLPSLDRSQAIIQLEKHGKTEERGLLNVPWEEKETWILKYFHSDANNWVLMDRDVVVETRAPVFGKWRSEPSIQPLLPDELVQGGLKLDWYKG